MMTGSCEDLDELRLMSKVDTVHVGGYLVGVESLALPELDLRNAVRDDSPIDVHPLCHVIAKRLLGRAVWISPARRITHQAPRCFCICRWMPTTRPDLEPQAEGHA